MPVPGYGVTFQPGTEQNGTGLSRTANPRQAPAVQEAIQVLSLRQPKVFGARAIAPALLLNAPGGMGQPAARGNVVAQALAQLAGLPPSMIFPQMASPALATPTQGTWQPTSSRPSLPTWGPSLSPYVIPGGEAAPAPSPVGPPRIGARQETGEGARSDDVYVPPPPPPPEPDWAALLREVRQRPLEGRYLD